MVTVQATAGPGLMAEGQQSRDPKTGGHQLKIKSEEF